MTVADRWMEEIKKEEHSTKKKVEPHCLMKHEAAKKNILNRTKKRELHALIYLI